MNISDIKIAKRLALGFGVILAFLVLSQVMGMQMLSRIGAGATELADARIPNIKSTNGVLDGVNDIAVALRNILLDADPASRARQNELIAASRKSLQQELDLLERRLTVPRAQAVLERMKSAHANYDKGLTEFLQRANGGDDAGARDYLNTTLRPCLATLKCAIGEQMTIQHELAEQAAAQVRAIEASTRSMVMVLTGVVLALTAAIAWYLTRSITVPMGRALDLANTVASGDLTSRIEVDRRDEAGQLLQALKRMNENLARTVSAVRSGTDTIGTAAADVAAGNLDLSARTEQQASSLEETASSMEELTSTVKQNADNARQANALAVSAQQVAGKGGEVVQQVVHTMGAINSSATRIVDIIAVIDGIAFQTNILALNAAVEAARAGEQGRGFAVVAGEVRNLAQRSAAAAKEIKTLIDDSVEKVQIGSELVDRAGATMADIVQSVGRVTDIMAEITAASQEQTAGIEQINSAVLQMDQVTQQNAALVEEASAAAQSLQQEAAELAQAVGIFRLDAQAAPARPSVAAPGVARVASSLPAVRPAKGGAPARSAAKAAAAQPAPKAAQAVEAGEGWETFWRRSGGQ